MRYALYYTPLPDSRLWQTLCTWLGRDPAANRKVAQPRFRGIDPDRLYELTRMPRRYGPHATLKAPFRLAAGKTPDMLVKAVEDFSFKKSSFPLPRLTLVRINSFFCLVPTVHSETLHNFAAECVQEFDHFRAQLTTIEQARRRAAILTEKEKHYLHLWGYPYVLDRYRFHITLTSRITNPLEKDYFFAALEQTFAAVLEDPLTVDSLSLFVEPAPGKDFLLQEHFPLSCGEVQQPTKDYIASSMD